MAAILEAVLRVGGLRVGKYTSPHLVDFRERIIIDGRPIAEENVVDFVARCSDVVEQTGATFFEATTAMAFEEFSSQNVDVAVVETGLGGRLDATNVVRPMVATVTSVGMDHMEYLGDTIEQISAEKAGIFKSGIPAVVGERDVVRRELLARLAHAAGASAVRVVADEVQASNTEVGMDGVRFDFRSPPLEGRVAVGLRGLHQVWNTCTAIAALQVAGPRFTPSVAALTGALGSLELPGRCQIHENIVFDVAHNPAGTTVLVQTLTEIYGREEFTVLFCALRDKDWPGMLRILRDVAGSFVFSDAPSAPDARKWDLDAVASEARRMGVRHHVISDFGAALMQAIKSGGKVLVTGSFHTVGDAMLRLQVSPLPR